MGLGAKVEVWSFMIAMHESPHSLYHFPLSREFVLILLKGTFI